MKASAGNVGSAAGLVPGASIAVVILALSLDSGGYGGVALGLGSAAAWIAIVVVALLRRSPDRQVPVPLLLAGGALAALLLLSGLSLTWSAEPGAGFSVVITVSAYLAVFVLAGMLLGSGSGRSALAGIAAGLVAVSLIAIGSRLLGIGAGDKALVEVMPPSAGRLSYPIGYWNALGAMAAMAIPVLAWLAEGARDRRVAALAVACIVPALLAAYMTSSRGALFAAALGAVVVVGTVPKRGRALGAVLVGTLATVPAVVAATLTPGILDSPATSPGRSELIVFAALVLGVGFGAGVGPAVVERFGSLRFARVRMRHALIALTAVLVAMLVVVGPGEIAGDFSARSGREATVQPRGGFFSLSLAGSGRAQFWSAAIDAFASDPARGIGAGAYPSYWNQHGGLETPVQNAHSEPLELLAELGLPGVLAFAGFFGVVAVAGIRRARGPGGAAGACLGLLATALVGIMIDWTWEVPALMVSVLIAAALICGRALRPRAASAGDARRAAGAAGGRQVRIPTPAIALVAIAFAVPAVWAGGVLAVSTNRLSASDEAFADGQLNEAAQAARTAAAIEPWAAEPWLKLATIEQAAGNIVAARAAGSRAIELAPDDFRSWFLASSIEAELGNSEAAGPYALRAVSLAPLIIPRALIDPRLGLGLGS